MNSREIQVIFIIKYCFPIKLKSHIKSCGIAFIEVIPQVFFSPREDLNPSLLYYKNVYRTHCNNF